MIIEIEHIVYKEKDLRESFTDIYNINNGFVACRKDKEYDSILEFAVLSFYSSNTDGSDAEYKCFWYGNGILDPLRECRHSWFGDGDNAGYVFYLNGDLMIDAIRVLMNYFNMD